VDQGYNVTAIAASDPNQVVLYRLSPDRCRAELIALHVLITDAAPRYNRRTDEHPITLIRSLLLPVPLSAYRAGFDPGGLVHSFDDTFWECRLADVAATVARLDDVLPCSPVCRWTTEESTDDGTAVDFVRWHGEGCPESEEDDMPDVPELEAV
jgi:hypothetical protein